MQLKNCEYAFKMQLKFSFKIFCWENFIACHCCGLFITQRDDTILEIAVGMFALYEAGSPFEFPPF